MGHTGKHRVHSTSPLTAVQVAAALTASGAFAAVVPPPVAEAETVVQPAPGVDLGPIIQCESGGDPKAQNSDSSASGLYQMINSTWRAYGGRKYASRAKDASPAEQTEVALRLYAAEGTSPWDASKSCWGKRTKQVKSGTAPAPAPTPAQPAPNPQSGPPAGVQLGVRDQHGRGYYRCDASHLRFDACDPGTVGQIVQYPVYDGHNVPQLPPPGGSAGVQLEAQATPIPQAVAPAAARGQRVVANARTWFGVKYVWGGTSRSGVDCSGLVLNVLRSQGVKAPRTADQQMRWSIRIRAGQAQPGDLVFRVNKPGRAYHVGIFVRPGRYIEAPYAGAKVREHAIPAGAVYGRVA